MKKFLSGIMVCLGLVGCGQQNSVQREAEQQVQTATAALERNASLLKYAEEELSIATVQEEDDFVLKRRVLLADTALISAEEELALAQRTLVALGSSPEKWTHFSQIRQLGNLLKTAAEKIVVLRMQVDLLTEPVHATFPNPPPRTTI